MLKVVIFEGGCGEDAEYDVKEVPVGTFVVQAYISGWKNMKTFLPSEYEKAVAYSQELVRRFGYTQVVELT